MDTLFLEHFGKKTAYSRTKDEKLGVFFLPGHTGSRASNSCKVIQDVCQSEGRFFQSFDWWGHGESTGTYDAGYVQDWCQQALDLFDQTVHAPLVIVGNSMGGPIAVYIALRRPHLCHAIIGRVSGFGINLQNNVIKHYNEPVIKALGDSVGIEFYQGENGVMDFAPISLPCPVRFIHGMKDDTVPWQTGQNLFKAIESPDAQFILDREGGHSIPSANESLYHKMWLNEWSQ